MGKITKKRPPTAHPSKYPSFGDIAYHHWHRKNLTAADEVIRREAAREFIEEDGQRREEHLGEDGPNLAGMDFP